jgi:hypothetical protein
MLAVFLITADAGLPLRLESEMLDLRFRLRPPASPPRAGRDRRDRRPHYRGNRTLALVAAGIGAVPRPARRRRTRVICLDLLFSEPQASPLEAERGPIETAMAPLLQTLDPADRRRFTETLSELSRVSDPDLSLSRAIRDSGPIIVPFSLDLQPGGMMQTPTAPLPAVLAKAAYDRVRGADPDHLPDAAGFRIRVERIAEAGRLAHVTTVPDNTGAYRCDYPVLRYADAYLPSFSLEAVRVFLGISKAEVVVDIGQGIDLRTLHVPTDRGMRLLVNYYPPGAFERISFADALLGADIWRQDRSGGGERSRAARCHCDTL